MVFASKSLNESTITLAFGCLNLFRDKLSIIEAPPCALVTLPDVRSIAGAIFHPCLEMMIWILCLVSLNFFPRAS